MALCSVAASRRAARATCCDPELPFALYRHEPPQPTSRIAPPSVASAGLTYLGGGCGGVGTHTYTRQRTHNTAKFGTPLSSS